MNIGWTTGYTENYWGDWFTSPMLGGSERIVVEVSKALAAQGHSVSVRLPYKTDERVWQGVRWLGVDAPEQRYELLLCADDFHRRDRGLRNVLVACRSDPPPNTDFDELIFLSGHHAELMGHAGRPFVGGGVNLADYAQDKPRLPRRVICTSSPDRCPKALAIGKGFSFVHSYRKVGNYPSVELTREGLRDLQQTAQVLIYPLEPRRPSDFFSMAVLEAMAAGTPVIVSDADSMKELWSDAAIVLPNPVDLGLWDETVERLLADKSAWRALSEKGRRKAAHYSWDVVAARYLDAAT